MNKERPLDAPTDRLFVSLKGPRRGQPLSAEGIIEIFSAARKRAGLHHGTCHELRHTCFTRLREGGMAIEAVQAQAGHRSIASTRIYLHLSIDWLAEEYAKASCRPSPIDSSMSKKSLLRRWPSRSVLPVSMLRTLMTICALDCVGLRSSRWTLPSNSVNEPRTFVTMAWRAGHETDASVGGVDGVVSC